MFKVYSIIVTFNGASWIDKCLYSLKCSSIQTKIIIIDNNSSDNTQAIIRDKYPDVNLIQSSKNLGFGKANNIGLKQAFNESADYVFLLNQDAWIETNTIEKLINITLSNENIGVLAPLNFSPGGDLEQYFQSQITDENFPNIISDLFVGSLKEYYRGTFFINASCWLMTKKCLGNIGGFDPIFDHYGEDVDYCKRAIYHNFEIGICTKTRVYHARDNYTSKAGNFQRLLLSNVRGYLNNKLLFHLKDLNINFLSHFIFESITILFLIFKSLIKLSFNYVVIYIIIFLKLQMLLPKIWLNRRICRLKQPSFLKKSIFNE